MKKQNTITTTMMMEMCMWTQLMCMTCCAYLSDVLSTQRVNPCAAQFWRNSNRLRPGDFIGVFRFLFFVSQVRNLMENYFEKLVRANFRFGRMCRCI